jgi:hypothetical protein
MRLPFWGVSSSIQSVINIANAITSNEYNICKFRRNFLVSLNFQRPGYGVCAHVDVDCVDGLPQYFCFVCLSVRETFFVPPS